MTERILRALGALCLLSTTACSAMRNCPDDTKEPIVIDHGVSDATALTYDSVGGWGYGKLPSGDAQPLDHFPAKTKLRFEHEMGVIPLEVKVYLSFDPNGANGSGPGSVAESAGNQDLIDCVDAHIIEIKNDTCEDGFYIRVTASDAVPTKPGAPDRSNACSE